MYMKCYKNTPLQPPPSQPPSYPPNDPLPPPSRPPPLPPLLPNRPVRLLQARARLLQRVQEGRRNVLGEEMQN